MAATVFVLTQKEISFPQDSIYVPLQVGAATGQDLGYIRDDELPGLFGQADLCLFPYREIYGSGALLMAYTYGRPVIASDIPVFREETEKGKTGLLFASEDAPDLARKLRQAMSWTEAERAERRRCIEELVRNKYSWARSARGLFDAYCALTEGRGRAAESSVKA